jgi:hypothetical protein
MLNASKSSRYSEIKINKNGKEVSLEGRTVNFSYYESLLSPHITAKIVFVDSGNALQAEKKYDTQERYGTIVSSLPVRGSGDEEVSFKIESKLGNLDFTSYPLIINSKPSPAQESTRQVVALNLVSKYAIDNENTNIYSKYYNSISDSVKQIITNDLKIPSTKISQIETTKNSNAFSGNSRRAFDVIISLCPKSIPIDGSAGYFFWETQEGFNFRSIDSLVSSPAVETYQYYNVGNASLDNDDNDYRILTQPQFVKDQNLLDLLRSGTLRSKNIFLDLSTGKYEEIFTNISGSGIKVLGGNQEYSSNLYPTSDKKVFSRTNHFILDTGNMEKELSTKLNNDPRQYLAVSAMKYNITISQVLNVIVPCNPNLKAGNVINCEFEKITPSSKNSGSIDESQSGKYLILHLCHNFDPNRSFTSLTLVRDTYGIYTSGGKI